MKYYLAYGSNLHVAQMKRRCPDAKAVGTAWLKGWRLAFRGSKTGAYLTIIPDGRAKTPVGVWEISDSDERALDYYEGFPTFYGKREFTLVMQPLALAEPQRAITGLAYIMDETRPAGIPSERYVSVCATGYDCFGFDKTPLLRAVGTALGEKPIRQTRRKKVSV